MALTDPELDVVADVLARAEQNALSMPNGHRFLGVFSDLTKPQQAAFIEQRVQNRRDRVANTIAAHTANAAEHLASLNAELAVLDGLLAKL